MQAIFSLNIPLLSGSVIGGGGKLNVLAHCTLDDSFSGLTKFENMDLNKLVDQLGKVFRERYHKNGEISIKLDEPDETWFSERLREAAMKMEPLCITPTGLKSPTNDSNPPDDPEAWESVTLTDSKLDYFLMPLGGDPERSTISQMRQVSQMTSEHIHGLDGSFLGKRSRSFGGDEEEDEEEEEEEQLPKRRK
ncbi:hypothetical protein BYT27DRAFT_7183565 [Phlegmacium glaucopus]|nr:hypothetical protein BYT27DRAFT_7183565 [Phlegmacium glaucopus]